MTEHLILTDSLSLEIYSQLLDLCAQTCGRLCGAGKLGMKFDR